MKSRNSSVELLRIICMILIIFHHYSLHGILENYEFSYINFNWQMLYVQIISCGGRFACIVFMLITGYYSISAKTNYKRVVKLIIEMFFYSWVISAIIYGLKISPINIKQLINNAFPIFGGNWFCVAYIGVCLIMPFINPMLNSLHQDTYKKLVIVLFVMSVIIPTFFFESPYFSSGFGYFIVAYITGGYIRKYSLDKLKSRVHGWKILLVSSVILLIGSVIVIDLLGMFLKSDVIIRNACYFRELNKLPAVGIALSMFMIAIERPVFNNVLINRAAASTLGIYLIHDNNLLQSVLWEKWFSGISYIETYIIVIHSIISVIIVFLACLAIDQIRILIFDKTIYRLFDKL